MRYLIDGIVKHSPDIKEFQLRPINGVVPEWTPGSHVELTFNSREGKEFKNAYSIIGESDNVLRIAVQREVPGRGGSKMLHDEFETGMEVGVHGPIASFALHPGAERNVLIAGGIGITPIISMAHALNANNHSFELHYLAREASRLVLREELENLSSGKVFTYTTEINRPDLNDLIGEYFPGCELHACGPLTLMEAIRTTATSLGWPLQNLHFESFGVRAANNDQPIRVHLRLSDMSLDVPSGTSILDAMISAGAFISYDCKRGECGNCYANVVTGQPIHRDVCLTTEQRATGMTTCVSWAEGTELMLDI